LKIFLCIFYVLCVLMYASKDARLFLTYINIIIYYRPLQSCIRIPIIFLMCLLDWYYYHYLSRNNALYIIIYIQYLFNMSNASLCRFETLRCGTQPYNNIGIYTIYWYIIIFYETNKTRFNFFYYISTTLYCCNCFIFQNVCKSVL